MMQRRALPAGIGKNTLRSILVEASWILISKDQTMRKKYDRIKIRSGGKRAIVAIARTLLLRMRRMLLNRKAYELDFAHRSYYAPRIMPRRWPVSLMEVMYQVLPTLRLSSAR